MKNEINNYLTNLKIIDIEYNNYQWIINKYIKMFNYEINKLYLEIKSNNCKNQINTNIQFKNNINKNIQSEDNIEFNNYFSDINITNINKTNINKKHNSKIYNKKCLIIKNLNNFDNSILQFKNKNKNKNKNTKFYNFKNNIKISKKHKKKLIKKLYYKIAKKIHPDKTSDKIKISFFNYIKYCENNNILYKLLFVAKKFKIIIIIDQYIYSILNDELNTLKNNINKFKNSIFFKWIYEKEVILKKKILLEFIKYKYNI